MAITSAPAFRSEHIRHWPEWLSLVLVALLALVAVGGAVVLRQHADNRRDIMNGLEQLETLAVDQSRLLWQAIAQIDDDNGFAYIRLRGDEQGVRTTIYAQLEALEQLEARGEWQNSLLGFAPEPELLSDLSSASSSFLAGIQSKLSLMSISSPERIKEQLRFGDREFDWLQEALAASSERNTLIAKKAGAAANLATAGAVLITFLAAVLGAARLSRVRARRKLELDAERLKTLAASEARFRALVQNGSDLIMVLEPVGEVRYASPSSADLLVKAADQVITKPVQEVLGLSKTDLLEAGSTEVTTANGRILEVHATDLEAHADVQGVVLNVRDITERKSLEEQMRYQALHDPLTDLPNRRKFVQEYDALTGKNAAVLFIDLDGFKLVNDSYGHSTGDKLLIETAERIAGCLGADDVLARQGGDEFLVLLTGTETALDWANRIQKVLEPPFMLQGAEVFVSASIGVVCQLQDLSADVAAQQADIAMYRAKAAGKARAVAFTPDMLADAPERLKLETDFRRGLERGEFTVYYQPKVSFASGKTESLEALVRWEHPRRGLVRPDLFIPFAEETGLIEPLGKTILEQACRDAARWQHFGVVVAVNLSPVQFRNPHLVSEVKNAIQDNALDPAYLELEITESAVLGDVKATIKVLDELKALGVRLAIDDFGTGYSNLSHLKHFNVDVLKIDQSFVRGGNPGSEQLSDSAIVEAVVAMAKAFGVHVVAEGVETRDHAKSLTEIGCDLGQGYYFSKPVTGEAIDGLLAKEQL